VQHARQGGGSSKNSMAGQSKVNYGRVWSEEGSQPARSSLDTASSNDPHCRHNHVEHVVVPANGGIDGREVRNNAAMLAPGAGSYPSISLLVVHACSTASRVMTSSSVDASVVAASRPNIQDVMSLADSAGWSCASQGHTRLRAPL
jgi:hypothetical protein